MNDTSIIKFDIGKVAALKKMRDKHLEISRHIAEMGSPLLDDMELLADIHDLYLDMFRRRGCPEKASQVYHRKKFLLVALYLYSPKTLAGGKMRIGLRDRLSRFFGLSASTPVSDNSSSVVFQYMHYADFRRDVDMLFADVVEKMGHLLLIDN